MKVLYFINKNNKWVKVSYEEYDEFQGEKEIRPANLSLRLIHSMLIQYR